MVRQGIKVYEVASMKVLLHNLVDKLESGWEMQTGFRVGDDQSFYMKVVDELNDLQNMDGETRMKALKRLMKYRVYLNSSRSSRSSTGT